MARAAVAALLLLAGAGAVRAAPDIAGATAVPVPLETLAGWADDDHAAAFSAFRRSCAEVARQAPAIRSAVPTPEALQAACGAALRRPDGLVRQEARAFFENRFSAYEISPRDGAPFLTGYYEPEFPGSLEPSPDFPVPLLGRPSDLVSFGIGEAPPGLPPNLTGARRGAGGLEPYPDRGAIEDGAVAGKASPIAHLRDRVDAFVVHVQGSARIRLPDGTAIRVAFAGRNGHPYTSVARLLVGKLGLDPSAMTADRLTEWLRANPDEGRELMRANRSFIFFRVASELDPADGPIGAAGIPVTPGRSLAVDRLAWSYGLPVWLEGSLPVPGGGREKLGRLVMAQDTGAAITGPARGDLFVGSGPEAGAQAGLIRERVRFVVLWPKTPAGAGP